MYSTAVTVTINGGTVTLATTPAIAPMPGDALLVNHEWCEVVGVSGSTLTLYGPYSGGNYTGPATLLQCTSSNTTPALRLRAEYEADKLGQKLGSELIDFLTTAQSTVDIHDYTLDEVIVRQVDSAASLISRLPVIATIPTPNAIPRASSQGTINVDWFNTPSLPIKDAGSSVTSAAVGPVPSSSIKVQAATGSNIVTLTPNVDRPSVVVISNQDSLCLELVAPTQPTAESLLRSTEFTVLLFPAVRLTRLSFKSNAVAVGGYPQDILFNRSGGVWNKYSAWIMRFVYVEGGFRQLSGGWSLAMARGPFKLGVGPTDPGTGMTADGATAIFPVDPAIDTFDMVAVDAFFPTGQRMVVMDIVGSPADKIYVVPFFWGFSSGSSADMSQGRFDPAGVVPPAHLEEGNARFYSAAGYTYYGARSRSAKTTGKWYWETYYQDAAAFVNCIAGAATTFDQRCSAVTADSVSIQAYTAAQNSGYVTFYDRGTDSYIQCPMAIGDTVGHAYDADAGTYTFYRNGALVHSLTNVPTGMYAHVGGYNGGSITGRFYAAEFAFAPPAGYQPWST